MKHGTRQRGHPRPAGLHFALLSGAFALVFAAAVIWLAQDQVMLLSRVRALQTNTLPQTIAQQKMARNLEVLRLQGERVLYGHTAAQRNEALFVVSLIANHPDIASNPEAMTIARETEQFLIRHASSPVADEPTLALWTDLSHRITTLADMISIAGVNLGNTDLAAMEEIVKFGNKKLLMAVMLAAVFIASLLLLLRHFFITPLQAIHNALISLRQGATMLRLPESGIAEIWTIRSAIEKLEFTLREKEAAQDELSRRERLLREIGRTAKVGGWELAPLSKRITWTDEVYRIHETEPGHLATPEHASDLEASESMSRLEQSVHAAIRNGIPFDFELQIKTARGNTRWVHVMGAISQEPDAAKTLFGTVQDISERKKIEASLEAARLQAVYADQAKSRFLSSASHDLRQPAHALGMFVSRLASLEFDPQTRHLVNSMDASVKALQDMLDSFLDLAWLDSPAEQAQITPFHLEDVFEPLRHSFSTVAHDKGLRLRIRPTRAWIQSDPRLLHRILINLVSNAMRYTHSGGVLVAARPTHDEKNIRIEVWDSGIGIEEQHHETIFDEFYQVDNAGRERAKGLGLGLSITNRICRLLNHSLSIRSALGLGTRFTLTVPLSLGQSQPHDKSQSPPSLTRTFDLNGLHILVIENDALGREALSSLLTGWGCMVTAVEGASMLHELKIHDQPLDFIISDFRLSDGIDGIEAVRMAREQCGREVAACLISGDVDPLVRQQTQAAGLVLLQKPVHPAKIGNLLRRSRQAGAKDAPEQP